jgi:hypothetical protein
LVTLELELVLVVVVLISVSFFKVSGTADVSFLVVSVTLVVTESVFDVSAPEEPLPLQAATDVAMAKAKKPILNEFFIVVFF